MRPSLLFAVTLVSVSFTEGLLAPCASACAAIPPGVLSTIPAAGTKTYPANAAIRLNGEGLSLAGLSATVGGKPAVAIAREGAVPPLGLALDLQPAPAPGELVTVAGTLCKKGNNAPFSCAIDIAYTASEADTVAGLLALAT